MGFQVFEKGSAPIARVPSATIQRRGLMSLNRSAWALIESPNYVELLWDPERRIIGLRPAEETNPNAYPVRPQSANTKNGPVLIAGSLFTQWVGLDTSEAKRWVPTVIEGVLCLDLNEPGAKVRSNRTRGQEKKEAALEGAAT